MEDSVAMASGRVAKSNTAEIVRNLMQKANLERAGFCITISNTLETHLLLCKPQFPSTNNFFTSAILLPKVYNFLCGLYQQ